MPFAGRSGTWARPKNQPEGRTHLYEAVSAQPTRRHTCAVGFLSRRRGVDPELVHAVLEDAPGRPEHLGGARLVEVRLLQRLGDDLPLELVARAAERLPAGQHLIAQVAGRGLGALRDVRQLLERDLRPLGE